MTDADIGFLPATELARLYRRKALSPVEGAEAVLRHIARTEPRVNAMTLTTPELALRQARAAEAAFAKGEDPGPLAGIPVTIKDLHLTAGIPTEFGSFAMKGNVPAEDTPSVARLHEAGTVMLGKTTASEFGWKGVSNSPLTGITHNPWKHGHNAGASSAGAGAAAAAGYGPLHQGSDGAGSIRMPAHFCGIYGLKPTFGRVPLWPMSNNDTATHLGPMTRTVADAALMLRAMAGPHPWDYLSLESPPADYAAHLHAGVRGKRIAFSPDLGHARVDPDVAAVVAEAAKAFEALGARVEQVTPAWGPLGPEIGLFFWRTVYAARTDLLEKWEPQMDPGFAALIRAGQDITIRDFNLMRSRKFEYCRAIHTFFQDWDFLLTPAVSVAAFPADRLQPEGWPQHPWNWLEWSHFSYPFDMSGNPAASVPAGFTPAGLPVGLQIVGPRFDDLGVLQASAALEQARPWADKRPPLA
ncbi:MAG: amidase [Proteobacteria bacterium]|nr:amidase [Pseudomonadota bacterium]